MQDKDYASMIACLVTIANNYFTLRDYENVVKYRLKALELQEMNLDKTDPEIRKSCIILGIAYEGIKDYDNAIKYSLKAAQIQESAPDKNYDMLSTPYTTLGALYAMIKEYGKVIENYEKALKICEREGRSEDAKKLKQLIVYAKILRFFKRFKF